MVLSAMSAALAPLVLAVLLVLRKAMPQVRSLFRGWNRRFEREMARWS